MIGKFILSCRNQKVITTRDKRKLFVPCGYCYDCAVRKANHANALCQSAASSYPFVFKIDLSYNETFVPKMRLVETVSPSHKRYIKCIDITKRPLKTKGKFGDYTKRFATYGKVIHIINSTFDNPLFSEFYAKSEALPPIDDPRRNSFKPLPRYTLRYSRFADVVNFIKRLRFYLASEDIEAISYYAVSEYGPQTFRPHFHLEIFGSDPRLLQRLEKCVSKAWKYGNYICELANSKGGSSAYISSYINSFTHLPIFLRGENVKPRASHSIRLGAAVSSVVRDYIYKNFARSIGTVSIPCGSGVYKYYPTPTIVNTLFPRCYDYSNKHISDLYKLYQVYPKLSRIYNTTRCSGIVDSVLRYGTALLSGQGKYIVDSFLRLLHITRHYSVEENGMIRSIIPAHEFDDSCRSEKWLILSTPSYYDEILGQDPLTLAPRELDSYTLRIWNRIYSSVCLSKYVHEFCCKNVTFDEWFEMLVAFHKKLPLTRLGQFYRMQEDYIKYTNDHECDLFYPIRENEPEFDYSTVVQGNLFIQHDISSRDLEYSSRVKHKEHNDLNKIFC